MSAGIFQSIPVILFCYNRPELLRRVLAGLKADRVPALHIFSDAPASSEKRGAVEEVRAIIKSVDWCEVTLVERPRNLGLGASILAGVSEVLESYEAVIVFEDDLICVPGTYSYLCAALRHYRNDVRVMSVTGWTHPTGTPPDVGGHPYFDGRAECWVWGTWARAWRGMNRQNAPDILHKICRRGMDPFLYGADLVSMAAEERRRNIWAVRWLYWHQLNGGLCLRPPWSMVEHIGAGPEATNVKQDIAWIQPGHLHNAPAIPERWPEVREHPDCAALWRARCGGRPGWVAKWLLWVKSILRRTKRVMLHGMSAIKRAIRSLTPPLLWEASKHLQRAFLGKPEWEVIPEGWSYAHSHPEVKGWNVEGVLNAYEKKWPRFVEMTSGTGPLGVAHESSLSSREELVSHNIVMTFGYVLSLVSRGLPGLKMLDWGGGIGHYYQLARQLHPELEIDYHCKDVSLLAAHGRKTFPQQHFYADESCLENTYDLVMASASLQYSEDWKGVLGRLAAAARGHLYLTLLPIVEHAPSFVFVQRPYAYGYDTEYLGWCLNRDELLAAARDHSLSLVRELVMGHQPLIVGAKEQNLYRGFLFSKQSSPA